MSDKAKRILAAFWVWQYQSYPNWIPESQFPQIEQDVAKMREMYEAGGRWTEGWLAAHGDLIDRIFAEN